MIILFQTDQVDREFPRPALIFMASPKLYKTSGRYQAKNSTLIEWLRASSTSCASCFQLSFNVFSFRFINAFFDLCRQLQPIFGFFSGPRTG